MYKTEELIQKVKLVSSFQNFTDSQIKEIIELGNISKYSVGEYLFVEGDPCSGMFVLLSGKVHLRKVGPQGQEAIMAVINPIIMFNEIAIIDGGPNPFSAIAIQDCAIWKITYENFHKILRKTPEIGIGLLNVFAKRNRVLISNFEDISFRSVAARTAKFLLDVSNFGTSVINRKDYSINDIAARLGTVPEAISRSINQFNKKGIIQSTRIEIRVTDPIALANEAQISPSLISQKTEIPSP